MHISISKARAAIEAFLSESSSVEKPPQAWQVLWRNHRHFSLWRYYQILPKELNFRSSKTAPNLPSQTNVFFSLKFARRVPTTFSLVRSSTCGILSQKNLQLVQPFHIILSYHSSSNFWWIEVGWLGFQVQKRTSGHPRIFLRIP